MLRLQPLSIKLECLEGGNWVWELFKKTPGDSKHSKLQEPLTYAPELSGCPNHAEPIGKWCRTVSPMFSVIICSWVYRSLLAPSLTTCLFLHSFILPRTGSLQNVFPDSFAYWVLIKFGQWEALAASWENRRKRKAPFFPCFWVRQLLRYEQ